MEHIIRIMGTTDEFKELDTDDWDIDLVSPEYPQSYSPIAL
jgi:hypothetical protein